PGATNRPQRAQRCRRSNSTRGRRAYQSADPRLHRLRSGCARGAGVCARGARIRATRRPSGLHRDRLVAARQFAAGRAAQRHLDSRSGFERCLHRSAPDGTSERQYRSGVFRRRKVSRLRTERDRRHRGRLRDLLPHPGQHSCARHLGPHDRIGPGGSFYCRAVDGIERGTARSRGRAFSHAWQHARRRARRPVGEFEGQCQCDGGIPGGAELELLTQPIGDRYRIMTAAIKAYPCIGTAQTLVAGILQARAGIADPARQVERVEVAMADIPVVRSQAADEQRRYPESRESADHSFYYLAAAALADGEISEAQFAPGRWLQPEMRQAMARVSINTDARLNKYTPGSYPAVVKLILRSGESREVEAIFPKGHPKNRMSPAEAEAKFRACARGKVPPARQDNIIAKARELEKLASVAELMSELASHESSPTR